MIVKYSFREGFSVKGDPSTIGERLEFLKGSNGELHPLDVVNDARSESSPLHACFEWDDTEAANQYRLSQARYIIRSIEITYEKPDSTGGECVVVQYANLGDRSDSKPYQDIRVIMSNKRDRDKYVRMVLRELKTIRDKYKHIKELSAVYDAIDKAVSMFSP